MPIPDWKVEEANMIADKHKDKLYSKFTVCEGVDHMLKNDLPNMYLNNVWRPNLSITGADGLPPISQAGNVVRAYTGARVSLRLPPSADANVMKEKLVAKLTKDVPYNA